MPKRPQVLAIGAGLIVLTAAMYWKMSPAPVSYTRVYKIGYNQNPPFQMRTTGETPTGLAVDTALAAARRTGIKLQWVFEPSLSNDALRLGAVDLWPLMADLPDRHSYAHFSDPWIVSDSYLIAYGATERLPPPDFKGSIHYAGPALYKILIGKMWPEAKTQELHLASQLTAPFCAGQYPLIFVSSHQATVLLRELSTICPAVEFRARHLPALTVRLSVASSHKASAVAERLRDEIRKMSEDGELGEILSRYSYVGLTEARTILQLIASEQQARHLSLALTALAAALTLLVWLVWHLRRTRHAAEQATIAKSEFLANMSHEIRTPLGGLIGMVELVLDLPLMPVQQDYLQTAHSSAKTLLSILNDILDFSRIEARRLEIVPIEVDIRQLVGEVVGLMSPVARNKGLQFESELSPAVPQLISADPVRIKQVLLNLMGNAIKFTEHGSVYLRLNIADGTPPKLVFQISDTGIGIAPEKQEQVFEPFRQADGSIVRKFGGSGLGLAISKQLAGMMGGRLWCESTAGKGSTFSFTLQFSPVAASVQSPTEVAAPRTAPAPSSLRILVAEDNPVNQKLITALLQKDGHEVTLVASGKGAVAAVSGNARFDLVLMDIQMPEMDGFQAAAAIRALDKRLQRNIPIVALTAHAEAGYQKICLERGMNSYLSKPIDRTQLRSLLAGISAGAAPAEKQPEPAY